MKLVHVTQHKSVATSNIILWADPYVIVMRQTVDHVDARLKTVCCTMQNHVITPCTISLHTCEVRFPRWASMDKVEQLCSIRLKEKNTVVTRSGAGGGGGGGGGNALVHTTFQEIASLSTAFKTDYSTSTRYPSHLEKFSSKHFHMTPRSPYRCPKQ